MTVLSDSKILDHQEFDEHFQITPFDEECVQPASYDLHVGDEWTWITDEAVDLHDDAVETDTRECESVTLEPQGCVLATTDEYIEVPRGMCAIVEGRSSLGRLFTTVHVTAGYIDPLFSGEITLEIVNHGPVPITIHSGDRIAQIRFVKVYGEVNEGYDEKGHYTNQKGATEANMNFK